MTCARIGRLGLCTLLMLTGTAMPALAQAPRVEVGLGPVLNGAASAGTVDANLLDPAGNPLALFRTTNRIAPGWGVEGLVSLKLRERLRLEIAVGWTPAQFESQISGDFEGVPALSATQTVNQFSGDAALVLLAIQKRRVDVFLRGSGGVFREITDDQALVDNGWRASAGGGVQLRLRQAPSGWFGRLALRADARIQARGGGIEFGDSQTRVSPQVFAGLVIGR